MLVVPSIICENIVFKKKSSTLYSFFIYIRNTLSLKIDFSILSFNISSQISFTIQTDRRKIEKKSSNTLFSSESCLSQIVRVTFTLYHRLGVRFYDIQIRACHLFKGMIVPVYLQLDSSLFLICTSLLRCSDGSLKGGIFQLNMNLIWS